jgi:MFS family permease
VIQGPTRAGKIGALSALYFVQGMPFGFQATALPIYLRGEGISLAAIGLASFLSLPWMLKLLWSPFVESWHSPRWGRRRSWIIPLQVCLALACFASAGLGTRGPIVLVSLVLLMNLFAATMDIAVDGLAVDILEPEELGWGNAAQVVGYKIGMLTGGGLLVWLSDRIAWEGLFLVMGGLVTMVALGTLAMPRPDAGTGGARQKVGEVLGLLWSSTLRRRGFAWLALFVLTYKAGESMADAMFKPFLVDEGFSAQQIGLWVGTWGMVFSLAGSLAGGWLASRFSRLSAVGWTALLRIGPILGQLWLSLHSPTAAEVIAVTAAEHFFGGALTTAMFAYMMSRVDRRVGASHFTLLATLEVSGKLLSASLSGVLAEGSGYPGLFLLAALLSLGFLALLVPLATYESSAQKTR